MRIKRYHEAPLDYFDDVQKLTDGDYALVHLFETNEAYLKKFKEAVEKGRDVILDNSLFELRTKFDPDRFAYWVKELKPTWYIVPDVWKDSKGTIESFNDFVSMYPDLPGKRIGVAQGYGIADTIECYKAIEPFCDKVAFNLHGEDWFHRSTGLSSGTLEGDMSAGRFNLIYTMDQLGVINRSKPHHLLGVGYPSEPALYVLNDMSFIDSIDTSSPVCYGLEGKLYGMGVYKKSDLRICDVVDNKFRSNHTSYCIGQNIEIFEGYCCSSEEDTNGRNDAEFDTDYMPRASK